VQPQAKVILDSVTPGGYRLTTLEVTYHRFVLAELNTHRTLSRNSGSSRAIPLSKTLDFVRNNTALPVHWGKNQKGMVAEEEISPEDQRQAATVWMRTMSAAASGSEQLAALGVHKQLTNRLIEPYSWQRSIFTATEWDNFLGLRVDKDAQPEFYALALAIQQALVTSTPTLLSEGQWHLPYVDGATRAAFSEADCIKVSAGRCAKVSYLTHETSADPCDDIDRCNRILEAGHFSPAEHQAMSLTKEGWVEYATEAFCRFLSDRIPLGNLQGWVQYRKLLTDEHDFSRVKAKRRVGLVPVSLPLLEREEARLVASRSLLGKPSPGVSCRRGCSSCCYRPVYATVLEGAAVYRSLKRRGMGDLVPPLKAHGENLRSQDPLVWFLSRQSCPLLTSTRECSVYDGRPMACRAHEVTSDPYLCDPHQLSKGLSVVDREADLQGFAKQARSGELRLGWRLPTLPLGLAVWLAGEVIEGRVPTEEVPQRVFLLLARG